jgi:hypothetical protein
MRHLLRQAGNYKVRSLTPLILSNFNDLLPVLRDVVLYLQRVLTPKIAKRYEGEFAAVLTGAYASVPHNNLWIYTLFQHPAFNGADIPIDYAKIVRVREKALIAKRRGDTVWIKDIKTGLDTLAGGDRRAVIWSASLLSQDEMSHWLGLETAKHDPLNSAVCSKVISDKKAENKK